MDSPATGSEQGAGQRTAINPTLRKEREGWGTQVFPNGKDLNAERVGHPPMTRSGRWMTAEENAKQLDVAPDYLRRRAEQEKVMSARKEFLREEMSPILTDLASVGIMTDDVWQVKTEKKENAKAIPILLDHLQRSYPSIIRAGIAQRLAVRATRKIGWKILVDEYRETDIHDDHVKQSIASALAGASDDSVINELIALAKDRSQGNSRILLLRGIRRSRRPEARQAIEELANDPDLAKEIKSWRRSRS